LYSSQSLRKSGHFRLKKQTEKLIVTDDSLNPFVNQVIFVRKNPQQKKRKLKSLNPFVNQVIFVFNFFLTKGANHEKSQSLRKSGHFRQPQQKRKTRKTLQSQSLRKSGHFRLQHGQGEYLPESLSQSLRKSGHFRLMSFKAFWKSFNSVSIPS